MITHLGFQVNLAEGRLEVPPQKLKTVRKELGKLVTNSQITCRKMAAILGQVRSFLQALPFLRAFTDLMVHFVDQQVTQGWDKKLPIPVELKKQVVEVKELLQNWKGREFGGPTSVRNIHSDSSTQGWGAIDLTSGQKLQDFWRSEQGLHINLKELKAAMAAVESFAKEGETIQLTVDNRVAYSYLKKGGGRLGHFNSLLRPFLKWCTEKNLKVVVNWVTSE